MREALQDAIRSTGYVTRQQAREITDVVLARLQPLSDERSAFEKWAAAKGCHLRRDDNNPDRYHAWLTNTLWNGWQARAVLRLVGVGASHE